MESLRGYFHDARLQLSAHPKIAVLTLAFLAAYELNVLQSAWRKVFVYFEVTFSKKLNAGLRAKKVELFEPLFRRRDSSRDGLPLRVVEIGLGGGSNFDFYPDETEVVGVDPNPDYLKYLRRELETTSGRRVKMVEVVCAGAEKMDEIIAEDSVDAVVATLVLCTVRDVCAVVTNCRKVLKPGGVFLFLHHNRADPVAHPWRARLQSWVTPLTYRLGDGCHFNRDPVEDIQRAGFSKVSYEKYTPPRKNRFAPFSLIHPFLIGCAVK